ncbi:Fe-S oxidoreductase [Clavibacter michiganensis]|uniref:Fe-S oxidoreductase n=1 Tax=Clavibacter michiganensis TaxID=28447 RepID=UPI0005BB7135|nr:Fe-S oxidoreductase [Clavibacter michiganensis]
MIRAGIGAVAGAVRGVLLDSPVSRAGSGIATAVALGIGLPLSTGEVRRHGDLIVLTGLPSWVFGRGGTCVGRVYLTRDNAGPAVLEHEAVHVVQWRRYGLLMPLLYAVAGRDPLRNRFEIEAGLEKGGYR